MDLDEPVLVSGGGAHLHIHDYAS